MVSTPLQFYRCLSHEISDGQSLKSKTFRANKLQSTSWGPQPETAMGMAMAPRLIISLQIFVAALSLVDSGWWASSFSLCFCSILQQKFFCLSLDFLVSFFKL